MKIIKPKIILPQNDLKISYLDQEMIQELSEIYKKEIEEYKKIKNLNFHHNRILELFFSRFIILTLQEIKDNFFDHILKINFINYTKLENDLMNYFSISHTKSNIFVGSFPQKKAIGFGIDVEPINRNISIDTEKLFINEFDIIKKNTPLLNLWAIKEACLKSFAQFNSPPKTLKEIQINLNEQSFFINTYPDKKGKFIVFNQDGFLIATAII